MGLEEVEIRVGVINCLELSERSIHLCVGSKRSRLGQINLKGETIFSILRFLLVYTELRIWKRFGLSV